MKLIRRFEKIFNRPLPLISIDFWFEGEYHRIRKITDGKMYFNPLFVYEKNKGVSVYYDVNNPDTDEMLIVNYFIKRPEKFKKIMREYAAEAKEVIRISKSKSRKEFAKLCELGINTWPKLTFSAVLGRYYGEISKKGSIALAYKSRKKFEKISYVADEKIIKMAKIILPNYKDDMDFLRYEEIKNKKLPTKEEIKKRKQGFVYFEGKLYTEMNLKKFEKLHKIKIIDEKLDASLKGSIAMKGKIKGIAKVILENKDLKKIKPGDILVASMTIPDFLPAMKKAAAFVTDEGGLLCHAAIVARELKKPCIIGTRSATKILKDGDFVEVDANKGIVNIIKKK